MTLWFDELCHFHELYHFFALQLSVSMRGRLSRVEGVGQSLSRAVIQAYLLLLINIDIIKVIPSKPLSSECAVIPDGDTGRVE